MNRRARRAAAAHNRKRHDRFYQTYIRHLPRIPIDAPYERGRVYHTCIHHDAWCRFYETENFGDCNCNPSVSRYIEPVRN